MKFIHILLAGILLALALPGQVLADGGANYDVKAVDGFNLGFLFSSGDPQIGSNKINVKISDSAGQPVKDARVSVSAELYKQSSGSSHGGMDMNNSGSTSATEKPVLTVKSDTTASQIPGEYQGELNLGEAGHWMIRVTSVINNQERSADFNRDVAGGGPNLMVLSIFGVAVIGIVAAAIVTRKKRAKVPARVTVE